MKIQFHHVIGIALIIIGLCGIFGTSGCDQPNTQDEAKPAESRELRGHEHMEYVKFDGHEYVMYNYLSRGSNCAIGGIAHSPKCSCMVKEWK